MSSNKQSVELTMVVIPDKKTGKYSAFFAQFPEAIAVDSSEDGVQKRLVDLFITMMDDKKEVVMAQQQKNHNVEYFKKEAKLIFA